MNLKYKHRLLDANQSFNEQFPEPPWADGDSYCSPFSQEIIYNKEVVLRFPPKTPCQEVNDAVEQFFVTIQRKKKLSQI
jgi:hypothetical protein